MGKKNKEYYVYVIGLKPEFATTKKAKQQNPEFKPGLYKKCYYVGYSSNTPEERYRKHITGHINKKGHNISSPVVFKYGYKKNGLPHKKYINYNPISTKEKAKRIEVELANHLRDKKGHCVYQK